MTEHAVFSLILLACCLLCMSEASKILLLPTAADNSHIYTLRKVYDEATLRGHNATFVILASDAASLSARDSGKNISYISHKGSSENLGAVVNKIAHQGFKPTFRAVMSFWHSTCDALLSDADTMATLKAERYDLIVGVGLYVCTPFLSAALDIPHLDINPTGLLPYSLATLIGGSDQPLRISYIPEIEAHSNYPMSFLERLRNAYMFLDFTLFRYRELRPMILRISKKHGIDLETPQARSRRVMTLYSGHYALEQARPLTPDNKLIGPIMALPAKPLPADLERFVKGAGSRNLVTVSMGSQAKFGAEELHAIAAALGRLPALSIWKVSKSELASVGDVASLNLSSNVKILDWLPQNDLLGQASAKAFLSHCGSNGMYEAAYHGVPIVCVPHFGDQEMNAVKVISKVHPKGFGLAVFRHQLTAGSVHDALLRVITDRSYATAAKRISKQIRSTKRTALQEAVDWVEHALETDRVPYLHSPDEELSWLALHSADVVMFNLSMLLATGAVLLYCMRAAMLGLHFYMPDKVKQV